jgi:hypothetical protein
MTIEAEKRATMAKAIEQQIKYNPTSDSSY